MVRCLVPTFGALWCRGAPQNYVFQSGVLGTFCICMCHKQMMTPAYVCWYVGRTCNCVVFCTHIWGTKDMVGALKNGFPSALLYCDRMGIEYIRKCIRPYACSPDGKILIVAGPLCGLCASEFSLLWIPEVEKKRQKLSASSRDYWGNIVGFGVMWLELP